MSDRYFGYEAPSGIDHPIATYPPDPAILQSANDATQRTVFAMDSENDATLPNPHIVEYWEMVRYDDHEKVYALAQAWKRMSELFEITGDNLYDKASWLAGRWSSPQARDEFLRRVGGAIKSYDEWKEVAYTNYSRLHTFAAQLEKTRGTVHEQYIYFANEYNKVFNPPLGVVDPGPGVRDPLVKATTAARPDMADLADTAAQSEPRYEERKYQGPLDAKQPRRSVGGSPSAPPRPAPPPTPVPPPPPTTQVSHPGTPPVTQPVGQPPVTPGTDPGPVLSGRPGMPAAPPTAPGPAPAAPPAAAPAAPPGATPGLPPSAPPYRSPPGGRGAAGAPPPQPGRSGTPPATPPSRPAPPRGAGRPGRPPAGATPPVAGGGAKGGARPPASPPVTPPGARGTAPSPRSAPAARPGQPSGVPAPAHRATPPVIPGARGQRPAVPRSEASRAIRPAVANGPSPVPPRTAGVPPQLDGRAATSPATRRPPTGSGTAEPNLLGRVRKEQGPTPQQRPVVARPAEPDIHDGEDLWQIEAPSGPAVIGVDPPVAATEPPQPEAGRARRRG